MRFSLFVAVLLSIGLLGGCTEKNAIVLGEVVVNAPRQLDDDVEDREAIRQEIIDIARNESRIYWKPGSNTRTHVLKLRVGDVLESSQGGGEFRLVTVNLKGVGKEFSYRAEGRGGVPEDLRGSVVSGFRDAWGVLRFQRELDLASTPRWVESLNHSDWRVREFALERIAQKRLIQAVPFLSECLNTEKEDRLRLRIIGVLAELKATEAVAPLVAITRNKNPALLLQVLHALGQIGGREAEAFLVTVATGHSIEGVRRVATEILKDMGADQGKAQKSANPPTSGSSK